MVRKTEEEKAMEKYKVAEEHNRKVARMIADSLVPGEIKTQIELLQHAIDKAKKELARAREVIKNYQKVAPPKVIKIINDIMQEWDKKYGYK